MRDELDSALCEAFPHVFADRRGDMRQTCMVWGFECGDGWYSLLYNCAAKLEKLILELPEEARSHCRASQVKEKFGTLRFYMTSSSSEMDDIISEAENVSARTCERCGNPGKMRGNSWVFVNCEECFRNYIADRIMDRCRGSAISTTRLNWKDETVPCIDYENKEELQQRVCAYLKELTLPPYPRAGYIKRKIRTIKHHANQLKYAVQFNWKTPRRMFARLWNELLSPFRRPYRRARRALIDWIND